MQHCVNDNQQLPDYACDIGYILIWVYIARLRLTYKVQFVIHIKVTLIWDIKHLKLGGRVGNDVACTIRGNHWSFM